MTATPEGRVAAALRQAAIGAGAEIRKLKWEGRNGAPDYFILLEGAVYLVECKAPGGRPRAQQMLEFERLYYSGLEVLVLADAAYAQQMVDAMKARNARALAPFSFKFYRELSK